MMRSIPALLLIAILLLLPFAHSNTLLSYIIQVEEQPRQDTLELTVTTTASDPSLEKAMALALQKAQKLKEMQQQICKRLIKDKAQCQESAEIGNVEISAKYVQQKKQTVYEKITATYTVVIKVQHVEKFGQLVDEILKLQGFVIEKIEWVENEDLIESNFLEENLQKNDLLCAQLGQNFIRVVQVEELREEPEEPQQEEEPAEGEEQQQEEQPEQEEPEQEEEVDSYKITIECGGKRVVKKSKESKK